MADATSLQTLTISASDACFGEAPVTVSANGIVYAVCFSGLSAGVNAFDGLSSTVIVSRAQCTDPSSVSIDDSSGMVFVSCPSASSVIAILSSGQLVYSVMSDGASQVFWAAGSQRLYIITSQNLVSGRVLPSGHLVNLTTPMLDDYECFQGSYLTVSTQRTDEERRDYVTFTCSRDPFFPPRYIVQLVHITDLQDAIKQTEFREYEPPENIFDCFRLMSIAVVPEQAIFFGCSTADFFPAPSTLAAASLHTSPHNASHLRSALDPTGAGVLAQQRPQGRAVSRLEWPATFQVSEYCNTPAARVSYSPATQSLYLSCEGGLRRVKFQNGVVSDLTELTTWSRTRNDPPSVVVAHQAGLDVVYLRDNLFGIQAAFLQAPLRSFGQSYLFLNDQSPITVLGVSSDSVLYMGGIGLGADYSIAMVHNLIGSKTRSIYIPTEATNRDPLYFKSFAFRPNGRIYLVSELGPTIYFGELGLEVDDVIVLAPFFDVDPNDGTFSTDYPWRLLTSTPDGNRMYAIRSRLAESRLDDDVLLLTDLDADTQRLIALPRLQARACSKAQVGPEASALYIVCDGSLLVIHLNPEGLHDGSPVVTLVSAADYGSVLNIQISGDSGDISFTTFRRAFHLGMGSANISLLADLVSNDCRPLAVITKTRTVLSLCAGGILLASYKGRSQPIARKVTAALVNPYTDAVYLAGPLDSAMAVEVSFACGNVPGFYLLNEQCTPCPPGSARATLQSGLYVEQPGSLSCLPCSDGAVSANAGSGRCVPCGAGFYSKTDAITSAVTCFPCSPGSFSNTTGTSRCDLCLGGSIAPDPSATACQPCDAGFYASGEGNVRCIPCAEVS